MSNSNGDIAPPKVPCGSCPYRRDVPAGIWHPEEYAKLPEYDQETAYQPLGIFMCHQKDGCLCGGWLLTHDRDHLLALRIAGHRLDPSVWDYAPEVEVFDSGAAAAQHGLSGVNAPSEEAQRRIKGIERQRAGTA
ncbi:MAG: DUF6283 family protein [Roseibium sp.]|uniref:DUF6283 family protein n=1 Tax=Roseibium sp. TaxID=1936156 RepID=UPI0032987D20